MHTKACMGGALKLIVNSSNGSRLELILKYLNRSIGYVKPASLPLLLSLCSVYTIFIEEP